MTQRRWNLLLLFLLVITGGLLINATYVAKSSYVPVNKSEETIGKDAYGISVNENKTYAVRIPEKVFFAGERVPLEDLEIRERLDREMIVNTYFHSSSILILKKANRWFPVIEPILDKYGIPDDFKYLAVAESGLSNSGVSHMGATGFWQFREAAAKEQGLVINGEVDERYHVEKSTEAACRYLLNLKKEFGTWPMAMAAYNLGMGNLRRQMERQKESSYWDLLLPEETERYVLRIVALKLLCENPEDFGFHLDGSDLYPPLEFEYATIKGPVESWADFAQENNMTYKELKWYNPWLREAYLKNTEGREYMIKLPLN